VNDEAIAWLCHEVNRELTRYAQDVPVQPSWAEAGEDMQASSVRGVRFLRDNPNAGAGDLHEAWCKDRKANGWKYGPVKDEVKKEHPALVHYPGLPDATKLKDAVFRTIVRVGVKL
jgi:hypothetical protein